MDTTLFDATLQYIPKSLTHRITINRQIKLQPRLKTHLYENTWLRNSTIPSVIGVEITDCSSKCLLFTNSIQQYKNVNIRYNLILSKIKDNKSNKDYMQGEEALRSKQRFART